MAKILPNTAQISSNFALITPNMAKEPPTLAQTSSNMTRMSLNLTKAAPNMAQTSLRHIDRISPNIVILPCLGIWVCLIAWGKSSRVFGARTIPSKLRGEDIQIQRLLGKIDCAGCVTGRMLRTRGIFCSIAPYMLNWGSTMEWILLVYQIYLIWKISTSLRSTCCLHLNWGKGWFGGGLGDRVVFQNSIYCFCFCYLLLIIFFSFCLYLGYTVFYLRFPF